MDRNFRDHLRYKLERARDNLIERIGMTREEFHTLLQDQEPGDNADGVSKALTGDRLARLEIQEREALRRITAALYRMREGRYGRCESCGAPIQDGRLEAIPEAVFCLRCEQRLEKERKAQSEEA
jgi:RNA polymerase-binding transcription factor DksA